MRPGRATRALLAGGLDEADCRLAAALEERRLRDPGLYPGMPAEERAAGRGAGGGKRAHPGFIELWQAMAELAGRVPPSTTARLLSSGRRQDGCEVVVDRRAADPSEPARQADPAPRRDAAAGAGAHACCPGSSVQRGRRRGAAHVAAAGRRPLRQERALPGARRSTRREAQRRANRLAEVVDYVAWQARRVAPGRVLVVTYKACEAAFDGIPGVETGHFNAIAGLDVYRDVRLLVVVGRPLPSRCRAGAARTARCSGTCPRAATTGRFAACGCATAAAARCGCTSMSDDKAELLRAAICDDEVIQAIGRGRGVNRTADDPLEVHVLADVALPLVHDRLLAWETVRPTSFQRMLLAGVAVDSPADAALLHPALFSRRAAGARRRSSGPDLSDKTL